MKVIFEFCSYDQAVLFYVDHQGISLTARLCALRGRCSWHEIIHFSNVMM